MAGIDKIYGSIDNWVELYLWLKKNKPVFIKQFLYDCPSIHPSEEIRSIPGFSEKQRMIGMFSEEADKFLYKNCPLKFVTRRLSEQYSAEELNKFISGER